jgi:hypothetical protein
MSENHSLNYSLNRLDRLKDGTRVLANTKGGTFENSILERMSFADANSILKMQT